MASVGARSRARVALCLGVLTLAVALLILSGCSRTGTEPTAGPGIPDQTTGAQGEPMTEADIKVIAAPATAFPPEQIIVVDYENFGNWAAAHVKGEGAQDTALALFKREGSEWTLFDLGTGLSPSELGPDAPAALIEWAFH